MVLVFVWMCAHACRYVCVCVHVCGSQRLMFLSFLQSLSHFLRQGLSLSYNSLISLGWLSNALGICLSLPPHWWNYRDMPDSLCG